MFAPTTTAAEFLPEGSPTLRVLFATLTAFIAAAFVAGVYFSAVRGGTPPPAARAQAVRAAVGSLLWLGLSGGLAAVGALHFSAPATMLPVFPTVIVVAIGIALSPVGRRLAVSLPAAVLVGFQSFIIVVELLMHRAYHKGLMPVQMSSTGRNMNSVSEITAAIVALW